jgi:hypothetical protein
MNELIIVEVEKNKDTIKKFLEREKVKYKICRQPKKILKSQQEEEKELAQAYEEWANDPEEWKNGGEDW